MKQKVSAVQRLKWKQLGYPMHFCGRHNCTFRLATLLERKVVVSTVGEYRPRMQDNDITMESLGGALREEDEMFYETFVFKVDGFNADDVPRIGQQLDSERCRTAQEAYDQHKKMCEKFQLELNMGAHR